MSNLSQLKLPPQIFPSSLNWSLDLRLLRATASWAGDVGRALLPRFSSHHLPRASHRRGCPAALPWAHSPTAVDMRPGPPSHPRTRRPSACPRNTGAWLRLPPQLPRPASGHNDCHPAGARMEGTGSRQQQLPAGPGTLRDREAARAAEVDARDASRPQYWLRCGKGSWPGGCWAWLLGGGGGLAWVPWRPQRGFRWDLRTAPSVRGFGSPGAFFSRPSQSDKAHGPGVTVAGSVCSAGGRVAGKSRTPSYTWISRRLRTTSDTVFRTCFY